jgi:hypothetical protein
VTQIKKYNIFSASLIALFLILCFSCRTHKSNLTLQQLNVSLLGGNNYPNKVNQGGIEILVSASDSAIPILKKFDVYCPLKKPIIVKLKKETNLFILSDENGKQFVIGAIDSSEINCDYSCKNRFYKEDKISFTSRLAFFPYWHGLSVLGGHPLFMRHHYYTLIIKKADGKKIKMQWTYSMQTYKPYNSKRKKWSGDYCVDNGGGLTKLEIK